MNIEELRHLCHDLPGVTEDVKWGNDLCFSVGDKMFCVVGLEQVPVSASFKVTDEEFDEMSTRNGFAPAPYVAKYKWVSITDINLMSAGEWKKYLAQSHRLIASKFSAKKRKELGLHF